MHVLKEYALERSRLKVLEVQQKMDTDPYYEMFHLNLLKYIREWSGLHSFIDGKVSEFYNAYKLLLKEKVNFPEEEKSPIKRSATVPVKAHQSRPKPINPNQIPNEYEDINMRAHTMTLENWMNDKETVVHLIARIDNCNTAINNTIGGGVSEEALASLMEYYAKLETLKDLITKASKGDQAAAKAISDLPCNGKGNFWKIIR